MLATPSTSATSTGLITFITSSFTDHSTMITAAPVVMTSSTIESASISTRNEGELCVIFIIV